MKTFQNDRGYALFTTVIVIVLFGLLSMALLSLTIAGAKKSAIREEATQVHELADKGIDHLNQQIHRDLELALGSDGLPRSEFAYQLMAVLNKYLCENEDGKLTSFDSVTGEYSVCIASIEDLFDESGELNELRKLVTLESTGITNDSTKTINYKFAIGSDTVPDSLKYALSTLPSQGVPKESDGNIYLHGGIEIHGDIKVDNNLFTFDHGPGLRDSFAEWRQTTLPVLYPSKKGSNAKIVLGGNLYQFNSSEVNKMRLETLGNNRQRITSKSWYDQHLNWTSAKRYVQSTVEKMFANKNNLPNIVKRDWSGNRVSITENIREGKNNIQPTSTINSSSVSNVDQNGHVLFMNSYYPSPRITFSDKNKFIAGKVNLTGNQTVRLSKGDYSFNSMYINKNLEIGNLTTNENPAFYDNITIGGYSNDRGAQLFVDGDVTIQGVNLKSNLTIYATGKVTVRHTTILGKEFGHNSEGSLIVFSKGKIHIANNSLYKNTPSELKGYFYSEQDLDMFGVGSNIKIHGGIAARRITLNAIRGNYNKERNGWSHAINPTSLQSPSRLTIQYDTELIENFLKLNPPEPVIYNVDPPELISRE